MNAYKPLFSSAPPHSILNAQAFHYTNSLDTDIRNTFARIRRVFSNANQRTCASPVCISLVRARDAV